MRDNAATLAPQLHITSLVVHSTPARAERVAGFVATLPGAEVHAISPQGKLVVTLEAGNSDEMLSLVQQIQRTDGVLSAAIVYECADTLEAMNELIDPPSSAQIHAELAAGLPAPPSLEDSTDAARPT